MNSRTTRPAKALAVIVAGSTLGLGGAFVAAAAGGDHDAPDIHTPSPELIQYAKDNYLVGLSPASLQTTRSSAYADMDLIEAYARANGLIGLSPASMQPASTTTGP